MTGQPQSMQSRIYLETGRYTPGVNGHPFNGTSLRLAQTVALSFLPTSPSVDVMSSAPNCFAVKI